MPISLIMRKYMHPIDHCRKYQNSTGVFRTKRQAGNSTIFSCLQNWLVVKLPHLNCSGIKNYTGLLQKTTPLNLRCDIEKMNGGIHPYG
jgi:hypothetical protein